MSHAVEIPGADPVQRGRDPCDRVFGQHPHEQFPEVLPVRFRPAENGRALFKRPDRDLPQLSALRGLLAPPRPCQLRPALPQPARKAQVAEKVRQGSRLPGRVPAFSGCGNKPVQRSGKSFRRGIDPPQLFGIRRGKAADKTVRMLVPGTCMSPDSFFDLPLEDIVLQFVAFFPAQPRESGPHIADDAVGGPAGCRDLVSIGNQRGKRSAENIGLFRQEERNLIVFEYSFQHLFIIGKASCSHGDVSPPAARRPDQLSRGGSGEFAFLRNGAAAVESDRAASGENGVFRIQEHIFRELQDHGISPEVFHVRLYP